jgi:hypothetical protein
MSTPAVFNETTGFEAEATLLSQYANSPTIVQLVQNMGQYFKQDANFAMFYSFVWNVNTAQSWGLDIWGKIVNVGRTLQIPGANPIFGFQDDSSPPDTQPFNQGTFNSPGIVDTETYVLGDDAYRVLVLAKALANISATTAPAINQILQNLFPGRGLCYVLDLGNMAMQYTFRFALTVTEYAILAQSNVLPRPAGVKANIVVIPPAAYLGFSESSDDALPFGQGPFYLPGDTL